MAEINSNIILNGITLVLHKAFPESKVYAEKVEQGLNKSDFICRLLNEASSQHATGEFYRRVPAFDIIYFPKEGKAESCMTGDKLLLLLKLIPLSETRIIRGRNISFEIGEDDVLHFFISYPYTVRYETEETDKMESLEFKY